VSGPTIHELFKKVREHPDFVFGAVFTTGDFDIADSENLDQVAATDSLVQYGMELIDDYQGRSES
jgi:hypothetical protein